MSINQVNHKPLSTGRVFLYIISCLAIFIFTAVICGLLTFWIPVNVIKITVREVFLRLPLTIIGLHLFAGRVLKIYNVETLYGRMTLIKALQWAAIGLLLPLLVWAFYYFGHLALPYPHTVLLPGSAKMAILIKWTAISVAAGITEEVLFRGHLFMILKNKYSTVRATLISSFIFGLVHIAMLTSFSPIDIVMVVVGGTIAGTMFACIYQYTKVIWYAAIVHVIWDIFFIGKIIMLSTNQTDANQAIYAFKLTTQNALITGRSFGIEAGLPCIAIYLVVIGMVCFMGKKNRPDGATSLLQQ